MSRIYREGVQLGQMKAGGELMKRLNLCSGESVSPKAKTQP